MNCQKLQVSYTRKSGGSSSKMCVGWTTFHLRDGQIYKIYKINSAYLRCTCMTLYDVRDGHALHHITY